MFVLHFVYLFRQDSLQKPNCSSLSALYSSLELFSLCSSQDILSSGQKSLISFVHASHFSREKDNEQSLSSRIEKTEERLLPNDSVCLTIFLWHLLLGILSISCHLRLHEEFGDSILVYVCKRQVIAWLVSWTSFSCCSQHVLSCQISFVSFSKFWMFSHFRKNQHVFRWRSRQFHRQDMQWSSSR
jgi:hypothetical protein